MRTITLFTLLLLSSPASAQMLPTPGERHAAHIASNVTVAVTLGFDIWRSVRSEEKTRAIALQITRTALVIGLTEFVKSFELSERPDGSDHKSFYSGHTALAFSGIGGSRMMFSVPLAVSTGGLRVAAGKHRWIDVLVGAGVGTLGSRIR
jgi:membrane-associated phospholipid phosphatase